MSTKSERLRAAVLEELDCDAFVNGAWVEVNVEDSRVHLAGVVDSYAAKLCAETVAQVAVPAASITNDLVVSPPAESQMPDGQLQDLVRFVLSCDALVEHDDLTVAVEDGWVRLGGATRSWVHRYEAERAVSYLTGVRGVTNDIAIVTSPLARRDAMAADGRV